MGFKINSSFRKLFFLYVLESKIRGPFIRDDSTGFLDRKMDGEPRG